MSHSAQVALQEVSSNAHQSRQAATRVDPPIELINSIGMNLRLIPSGEFQMGTTPADVEKVLAFDSTYKGNLKNEQPPLKVRITKPFYLGIHEVTNGQFRRFVQEEGYKTEAERDGKGGPDWSKPVGPGPLNADLMLDDTCPVVRVTWNDALAFAQWLSGKEKRAYRLPTEAEWEYACRAGTHTLYYFGNDPEELSLAGNYAGTSMYSNQSSRAKDGHEFLAPVGQFPANDFGLFDMHGNVQEWCSGWYGNYRDFAPVDPTGPATGMSRPVRGGSWSHLAQGCRSAYRGYCEPTDRGHGLGFRLASSDMASESTPGENTSEVKNSQRQMSTVHAGSNIGPDKRQTLSESSQLNTARKPLSEQTIKNAVGMELVLIRAGQFLMGETPQVEVVLTQPFYLAKSEVTRKQWFDVMKSRPPGPLYVHTVKRTEDDPVSSVNWYDALEFCNRLSELESLQIFYTLV